MDYYCQTLAPDRIWVLSNERQRWPPKCQLLVDLKKNMAARGCGQFPLCTPDLELRVCIKKYFPYYSTKTYVVGTQKNRLNETVLLSTQNIKLMGKKIYTIVC